MRAEDVSVVVLCAGSSLRYGSRNKLVETLDGKAVAEWVLETVSSLPFKQHILVVGHDSEAVSKLRYASHFQTIKNSDFTAGMGSSIAIGVRHTPADSPIMIVLGDMPFVTSETLLALFENVSEPHQIAICHCEGADSPPTMFGASHWQKLGDLKGEDGAKRILLEQEQNVVRVAVEANELRDIDLPEDYGR